MSYYNPRLIGGSYAPGILPRTGLAWFFGIMLALLCAGLALGFALFATDPYQKMQRATVWLRVGGGVAGGGHEATGFLISEDGYLLTAAHVVNGGNCGTIEVVINSGTQQANTLHATCIEAGKPGAPTTAEIGKDYALLKVEADRPFPHLTVVDSRGVKRGDKCFIAGFPWGSNLQTSIYGPNIKIQPGHITAVRRGGQQGAVAFDTDADAVQGMSGGPCTDERGNVIGIISMGRQEQAVHLILPTARFRHIWKDLTR